MVRFSRFYRLFTFEKFSFHLLTFLYIFPSLPPPMTSLPTLMEAKQTAILLASNQPLTSSQHVQINKLLINIFGSSNLSRILLTEAVLNCLRHQKAPKCVATIDEYSAQFSWEKTRDNNNLKPLAGPTAKIKRIDERGQSTVDNQFENYEEKLRFTVRSTILVRLQNLVI